MEGDEKIKSIKQCSNCGKLIKIKSKFDGSSKYCDKCAEEIQFKQKKEWDRNNR